MADKPTTPPPAYFLSLSLENVRSFGAKQTISFARPDGRPAQWTIILGDNGVGKTTVLKSLATLQLGQENSQLRSQSRERVFTYKIPINWFPTRFTEPATGRLVSSIQLNSLLSNDKGKIIEYGHSINMPGSDFIFRKHEHTKPDNASVNTSGHICYGYGAGRTTGNSTLSETTETIDTCASLFDDRANLLNPEEWFLFADYRMAKDKDPLTTQNFNLIKAALLKIMEEGEVTDLDVAPMQSSNGGSPRQGVRFETPYGWVRLRDMSLGYQTLVVWLTDLADKLFVRYPDSKNPLAEPAIVLVDEIDLHLHPSWQRKLLKSLSEIFINTQFIATAHSPLVVQAAGDAGANIVLLRREGDQTVVVTNVEDVRGWRLDQILTSELFGLETARSLETEKLLKRRAELLSQATVSAADKQELASLTEQLDLHDQPLGETPSEKQVHAVLRQLRQKLGKPADA